jgi:lysyl-tRNA synthetase class 2
MAMDETNSLIEQRKAKLASLRAKGIDPFKNKFTPTETCAAARANYAEGREVALAGRITAHREMGKSQFIDIRDQSGRMQVYAQKNVLGDEQWNIFTHLDLGDFIGVRGTMFTTKTGEISVKLGGSGTGVPPVRTHEPAKLETHGQDARATTPFVILAKALRPPPAKWHGLEDTEIRYRQRYLDLIGNPEVKEVFLKRSAIVHEIRVFFHSRGYVEVETPAMQAIPGGAAAQPFKTFHNALGCDFYLRIALELYHKRLLVGGIDKLFEIGKNFRNEGLSRRHNPEFTMLEAYQAFGDYETMMETVQSLICYVAQKVCGTLVIQHANESELTGLLQSLLNNLDQFGELLDQIAQKPVGATAVSELRAWLRDLINASRNDSWQKLSHQVVAYLQEQKRSEYFSAANVISRQLTQASLPVFHRISNLYEQALNKFQTLSDPKVIDLTPPWPRMEYKKLVREFAGDNWFELTSDQRFVRALELGVDFKGAAISEIKQLVSQMQSEHRISKTERHARLDRYLAKVEPLLKVIGGNRPEDFEVTGAVFEKLIEPTLIQPTFVTHLPKELVPLAKLSPDDPSTVEVFECCINGQEIAPGYTEQNDPIAQRTTLEHQAGGEQQKLDEDFLVALEHGMPPAGGIGIGIDRLCMMLLGQESIRDVILFPQLKPK